MLESNPFPTYRHRGTASAINKAKRSHRTDLSLTDWVKAGYAADNTLTRLSKVNKSSVKLARIDACSIDPETFYREFLQPGIPVIVSNAISHWPVMREGRWELETLGQRLKHSLMKIGEDDDGRKIKSKFKYFYDYLMCNQDDSPLYLFESGFETDLQVSSLLNDFSIPDLFPCDYLNMCGRENRPPHRWFCVGPERSGSTVHKDPVGTSAWNAVTHGRKRWVLFEPHVSKPIARGRKYKVKGEDDEAIHYFDYLLPRIIANNPNLEIYEGIQKSGDIIFVPGGWWHGVLNLEHTVAVTQNYCGPDNFDHVWTRMNRDRPGLCLRWERNLRKYAPPLWKRIKKHLKTNNETMFPHGETSSDSSDSSASDYSSSDEECDIDWIGCDDVVKRARN